MKKGGAGKIFNLDIYEIAADSSSTKQALMIQADPASCLSRDLAGLKIPPTKYCYRQWTRPPPLPVINVTLLSNAGNPQPIRAVSNLYS